MSAWEFNPPTPQLDVDTSARGESELVPETGVCSLSLIISTAVAVLPFKTPSNSSMVCSLLIGESALLGSAGTCCREWVCWRRCSLSRLLWVNRRLHR